MSTLRQSRPRKMANTELDLKDVLLRFKRCGYSDIQLATLLNRRLPKGAAKVTEDEIRALRQKLGVVPVFKAVDTCAGEFEAQTPYFYSTYETHNEATPSTRKKVVILGGGPNRIGQGIEFDYCCVQAVFALKQLDYETIMINSNPETVSTDYDTSDRLYFEPLTTEDVLAILELEKPFGVIVQFGGQTPLNLAHAIQSAGFNILGTSPDNIDLAEDRQRFGKLLDELGIPSPPNGSARTFEEVKKVVARIGYPVMVRPSYVLGGRAMEIVFDEKNLERFVDEAADVSPNHPILIDQFLDFATEVDVDALCDGRRVTIAAIMEHIEEAGIHSGDSACVIPTRTLSDEVLTKLRLYTEQLGLALSVKGLMNIQFAVRKDDVYVLEVNPRASRTVPYVSKTIGVPIAQLAAKIMIGQTLEDLGFVAEIHPPHFSVKEAVLPFHKFPDCQVLLGPEMRSTGEVMGVDPNYGLAFAKAQAAAGMPLPTKGSVLLSIHPDEIEKFLPLAQKFKDLGFSLFATTGSQLYFLRHGIESEIVCNINESRPNVVDFIINGKLDLIIHTFWGKTMREEEKVIR
ncbi:MAG: carbamoyl-phosphate synthase large subunit, partial [bacterium]